tara:strand:- start:2281 stop:2502 length:222 start_codon:yes stop_codon:yes gene_type:complete
MAQVTVTLSAGFNLTDDGGHYQDETGRDQRQIEAKADNRIRYYQRQGDSVSYVNSVAGGETGVEVKGDHTVVS